jgi:hypothetical protein
MKPTIGRIVHYVLSESNTPRADAVGASRPAIIVQDWGNGKADAQEGGSACNLQVFTDGSNDGLPDGMLWVTSACYSSTPRPGSWHWPPRA